MSIGEGDTLRIYTGLPRWRIDGLRASWLLATHGHFARQAITRGAVDWRASAQEDMGLRVIARADFWHGKRVIRNVHTYFGFINSVFI